MIKLEMATVVRALESVRGAPILTSNQCHDLALAINAQLAAPATQAVDEEAERARFEGWAEKRNLRTRRDGLVTTFADQLTDEVYQGWLARAALAAPVQSEQEAVTVEMRISAAKEMLRLGYGQHESHAESILRAALVAAPVRAVRLPDKKERSKRYWFDLDTSEKVEDAEAKGWNACLDAVAQLNAQPVAGERDD